MKLLAIFVAGSLGIGRGPTDPGNGGGVGDDGSGADAPANGDGDGGGPADAFVPRPDASCGAQQEDIELINLGDPPDLLIVLDRSGSMNAPAQFPDFTSKWTIMKSALKNITMATESNIRYGLEVFPTDDDCAVAPGA